MDTAAQTQALQEQKERLEKEILDTKQKLAEQSKVYRHIRRLWEAAQNLNTRSNNVSTVSLLCLYSVSSCLYCVSTLSPHVSTVFLLCLLMYLLCLYCVSSCLYCVSTLSLHVSTVSLLCLFMFCVSPHQKSRLDSEKMGSGLKELQQSEEERSRLNTKLTKTEADLQTTLEE